MDVFEYPVLILHHKLHQGSTALFPYKKLNKIYILNKYQTPIQRTGIPGKSGR